MIPRTRSTTGLDIAQEHCFSECFLQLLLRDDTYQLTWSVAFAQDLTTKQADTKPATRPLVMAHYMPWFTAKPFSQQWGWHWTMNHFDPDTLVDNKRRIASHYDPLIGPYDSGDPDVLEYHLLTMKIAGLDGVIVDWYGLSDFRDYALLHHNTTRVLQQCERLKMKFVICYEDQTIPALADANKLATGDLVPHAIDEVDWLSKYWFKSGSYVKLNDRAVLLSFGHAGLSDQQWEECLSGLQNPVAYFSQDYQRSCAIGGFGWPAPQVGLQQIDHFLRECRNWTESIPVAFPRFHDVYAEAGVGEGYPQLPDNDGRTFIQTFEKAQSANPRIIQIATWNDWGEGTQIEPSHQFGFRDLIYLQNAIQQEMEANNRYQESDFRIPLKILHGRKQATADSFVLDQMVDCIIGNQYQQLRRLADSLE